MKYMLYINQIKKNTINLPYLALSCMYFIKA